MDKIIKLFKGTKEDKVIALYLFVEYANKKLEDGFYGQCRLEEPTSGCDYILWFPLPIANDKWDLLIFDFYKTLSENIWCYINWKSIDTSGFHNYLPVNINI